MREVVHERQQEVDYDAWFKREVQKGMDDIAAGNVWSNEEVEAEFALKRADLRRRLDAAE